MIQPDGTRSWPGDHLSPVDKVALALADVMRARSHVNEAMTELARAVEKLVVAARGDHR